MAIFIPIGTIVSLLGLAGLVWCILRVAKARRNNLTEQDLAGVVQSVLPWNMAALFLSVTGLMMVVVGILLG